MEKSVFVYIMASARNGTLYVGVMSDLARRAWEHREGMIEGFTKDHGVKLLVWNEWHPTALEGIAREKRIKKWRRAWKIALIEAHNSQWLDQYETLFSPVPPLVIPGDP